MAAEPSPIRLNGVPLAAEPEGALHWADEATLVVADLHLEKGTSYAPAGSFLPPYDTRATLAALATLVDRLRPQRVICLGDSFHDGGAAGRLDAADQRTLADAIARVAEWWWVAGNHDPTPPDGLGGRVAEEVTIGPLVFRHQADAARPDGEVSGHYHPRAAVKLRHGRLGGRCFVEDGRRLILPAFGAYAGGLDVRDPAIADLFAPAARIHVIGRGRIHAFPVTAL